MKDKEYTPLNSLIKTIGYFLAGRLHFPRARLGERLELDGETWVIFRQVIVDPAPGQPQRPGAIFRPRFHVQGMSLRQNMLFSWLPIPFYIGLPGFRSKLWMVHESSGDFAGYYEWDTVEAAARYSQSFAANFMTRRSVPGSVSFRIIPNSPDS